MSGPYAAALRKAMELVGLAREHASVIRVSFTSAGAPAREALCIRQGEFGPPIDFERRETFLVAEEECLARLAEGDPPADYEYAFLLALRWLELPGRYRPQAPVRLPNSLARMGRSQIGFVQWLSSNFEATFLPYFRIAHPEPARAFEEIVVGTALDEMERYRQMRGSAQPFATGVANGISRYLRDVIGLRRPEGSKRS